MEDVESIKQKMKTAYRLPCEGPPQRGPCFCLFLRAVDCSWRFPVALCFAVWTFPVFLSPVEPLTLQVGGEASHWHRMSEVERQVATLSGRCQRHDEKLGQLVALLQKLQARVDLADGSRDGGSPPVRSVGGRRLKGAGAGGLPGSTVTRGGSQAQGAGGEPCGRVRRGAARASRGTGDSQTCGHLHASQQTAVQTCDGKAAAPTFCISDAVFSRAPK